MDDATMTHLVNRRIAYVRPKEPFDPVYKKRVSELTLRLMQTKTTGPLQDAFEAYVSECIVHFKQQDAIPLKEQSVMECDAIMYKTCMFSKDKIKVEMKWGK
jgi:hypothetical protein